LLLPPEYRAASASAASARSVSPICSYATDSYAFAIDGTIVAGPNRLLLRGLAMTRSFV
jgi:hypothetical protein